MDEFEFGGIENMNSKALPYFIASGLVLLAVLVYVFTLDSRESLKEVSAAEPIAPSQSRYVSFYHDDDRRVSCWIYSNYYQGGISCIPDKDLNIPTAP